MTENEKDVAVTAFIQGYAKCMADVQNKLKQERYFDIEKATDDFKKFLEAK